MHIARADLEIQREPFIRPFAFKGASFQEKWILVVRLEDEAGRSAFGVGGLAVLWSDARVFAEHSEVGGNALMVAVLERALALVRGEDFAGPQAMFRHVLPEVYAYAQAVTRRADLRPTFALNALVALDNAAWVLSARQAGATNMDDLLPPSSRGILAHRQRYVAAVPAIGYASTAEEIAAIVQAGAYLLKIKIGHPGDQATMLAKDCEWLSYLHGMVEDSETPMTESGKILYYLDANGRYECVEDLLRLLQHAERIGMLQRIVLLEEPLAEELVVDVGGVPARLAADESLHSVDDVVLRAEQGYGAIAVKAAGKTMSLALEMVAAADGVGLQPFVADNACVPILVDWNKSMAGRLPAFPGLKGGIMETNGLENYGRETWRRMLAEHPCAGADWLLPTGGSFVLGESFYAQSGGILADPKPYSGLFQA